MENITNNPSTDSNASEPAPEEAISAAPGSETISGEPGPVNTISSLPSSPGALGESAPEKAVIDRFEGSQAVLTLKDGQEQLIVPRKSLPRGVKEGYWLQVVVAAGKLVSASIDQEEFARAKQRIAEKLAMLRKGAHLE